MRVLETASRLFYDLGIRAVGVEAIAEQAGVTKKTLYDCFGSKDDLIVAYLRARDGLWRSMLVKYVNGHEGPPGQRILATFGALQEWSDERNKRGCAFINASVELAEDHPARDVARQQKAWFLGFLEDLAREGGAQAPADLAAQVLILHEGACIADPMGSVDHAVRRAEEVAAVLIERSLAA
ncbi:MULTISPECIES: TetR/AcrR family transcriptional regulator [unclassified Streptomyces]|uniref:TetR/AcrR family transcriptional regulator n=1 Tax=unclassified Streptomyces TaxID=2593676 RepID=UPI0009354C9E|nr:MULTISPECIES: TetR/AcrR family transcriptional regulator [unclassified Streptomyces]QWQ43557.1 TetR/AcrR family transcriptional regulator [Streptomyces sp. YPW6]